MNINTKPTYENDKQITTFNELQKYIGKYIYFSYESGRYYYAWIKKITKIEMPNCLIQNATEEKIKEIKQHINHINTIRKYRIYGDKYYE